MKGLVTVFGGSGFLGSQIVRSLAKEGYRVRVAVRRPAKAYRMRMLGDVGQIQMVQANLRNPPSIGRALDGAEAVINAAGLLNEAGRQKFLSVHAMGARHIAEAAAARGISRYILVSAVGAAEDASSRYARSKHEGEAAVRELIPGAVIVRPSVMFGPGDTLFNRFAFLATMMPALPLIGGGETKFQPVYVNDVAAAVTRILGDPGSAGQTYELGGPTVYSAKELMALTCKLIGKPRALVPLPFGIAKLIGVGGDLVAGLITPPITTDQVDLLRQDNVAAAGAPGFADLGIAPTAVEAIIPTYLYRYRRGGQYADQMEEVAGVA